MSIFIRIIRNLYYALFLTAPLVMYSGTSELFEFNKMMLIYAVTTIIVLLWLLHHIVSRQRNIFIPFFSIFYLLFFITQLISTVTSIDVHTSIFGYYGRFNGGLLSIIAYLGLFFVFINVFEQKSALRLLRVSLVSSLIVMLWGLPGKFNHDLSCLVFTGKFDNSCWTADFHPSIRMFSTLGQPNWLGAYLVINFFIGLHFWMMELTGHIKLKITKEFVFYSFYLLFNFVTILFTRSRSTIVALVLLMTLFPLVYFFLVKKAEFKLFIKIYGVLMVVVICSMFIFKTGIAKIDDVFTKTSPITNQSSAGGTESLDIRKIVWQGAADLGIQYPFFGTGVETFAYAYYFTRPQEHNLTSEWDFLYNKAHNEYLNYFATTGALGLSAYLVLIGYAVVMFYRGIRKDSESQLHSQLLALCLLCGYISILITDFFGFSTTTTHLFFFLLPGFLYALNQHNHEDETMKYSTLSPHKKTQYILTICIGLWILVSLVRYYMADLHFARAENYIQASDHTSAAMELQKALSLHHEHVYEDKLSYSLASVAFIASYEKESTPSAKNKQDTSISDRYIQLAKYFNDQSIQESPKNVLYYKTTSKNDYLFYQISLDPTYLIDALAALKQAAMLSPTDPKLPYTSALFYSLMADEVGISPTQAQLYRQLSLEAIDKSIDLKPDYRDAYFLKGQLLKKYGRKEEAQEIFTHILKTFDPKDQEVLQELTK